MVRRFRNDIIVSTVKLKYGVEAGQAVRGLLLANARFEQAVRCFWPGSQRIDEMGRTLMQNSQRSRMLLPGSPTP